MIIVFAPAALEDLAGTLEHIGCDSPDAAVRLQERVLGMVARLAEGGLDGPAQILKSGENVRSWPIPPLRIYYQREPEQFNVLCIYHQAREPIAE